uniref:Desmoplakin n=1 Tax=Oncorhynchus kisutch TaxID=8019 RepID=A0A8C7MNP7_ONCKI
MQQYSFRPSPRPYLGSNQGPSAHINNSHPRSVVTHCAIEPFHIGYNCSFATYIQMSCSFATNIQMSCVVMWLLHGGDIFVFQRLIETSPWGDDSAAIEQQLISHNKFHSSIQRSAEVDRAKDELFKKGDKANQHALDQDWDTLQKMSHGRSNQLRELQQIIEEISREIMWVNEREEEELVFDWGEKNIDLYIPKKQESYSKLMSTLEEKEKDLNKLKLKVDSLLKNHHPASDKIEAYMDTLQTQWSWLLQITKCIHVHLKENAAYSQFFKEANETYSKLQKEHENIRRKFTSDRNTPLENLLELLNGLEKEKEWILENKRQVQHLVNMSKSIVRLRPRNPEEEKSSSPVMVQALCDFKQDQKVILKGNEGILKDNSQRSKWQVTGPGGLDMLVPSVCLLVPPPNSLGINLANKNEQYYEAILSVWNQLYINIKSLISWQYCVQDITRINSLTITMLSRMRPEEYRSILKGLETHYSDFIHCCHGSEMFKDDDKRNIESQYTGAQAHYDQLVVQLPAYNGIMRGVNYVDRLKQHLKTSVRKLKLGHNVSSKWTLTPSTLPKLWQNVVVTSHSLTELHTLRQRLEEAEAGLTQHIHICLGEDGVHDCGLRISQLESVQRDVNSIREEYQRLNEHVLKELEGMTDSDKATFLRSQLSLINERLGSLDGCSTAYLQRLRALRALLESESRAEDIIKVHEARLTEKETTSLDHAEVEDYRSTLKSMRAELEGKRDVLVSMETELGKAVHWNGQVGGAFHRCDVDLSRYSERVTQLSDRWRRLQSQIDFRLRDLEGYQGQLQQYTTTSSVLSEWIGTTRQKQDTLQATKIDSITALDEHLDQQKALNSEIKVKRESVESVLRDTDACVNSIKDYELELASYSAGLETLLNIPMKRTMTQSPSTQLTEEATLLQTRYIELLTLSGDYYKYLGELHKNMEELKMRNTRIDLLEEELRLLKEDIGYRNTKNSSLEEALARYRLELSQSQEQLHSVEEVKRSKALQCSVTQDSLASTHSQLKDLQEQVARLTSLIEEEKRKRMRAEEHYREQQEEHEQVLRRRQKELEEANWAKLEVEKSVGDRDREAERLRRQLEEEVQRCKDLEQELSKTSSLIQSTKTQYSEMVVERDALLLKLKQTDQDRAMSQKLEEELNRIKLSLESELRLKLRLQEENEKVKNDFLYWKGQYESKEGAVRQFDSVKEKLERERSSLETEIERLMRELREGEDRYKSRLLITQTQLSELTSVRDTLEADLRKLREQHNACAKHTQTDENGKKDLDPGLRGEVSIKDLMDANLLEKSDMDQLKDGKLTSQDIEDRLRSYLRGSTCIAGVYDEANHKTLSIYQAMKEGLLRPGTTLELLEAQAASGFMIDPINNLCLTVADAYKSGLAGPEFKDKLLSAERAVTGYKDPGTDKIISLFQAIEKGLMEKGHGIRLLEAQIASGGIIDPRHSHRIEVETAYKKGYFGKEMNQILTDEADVSKGFFDPNNQDNLTYLQLKKRCIIDQKTGLVLLPIKDKKEPPQTTTQKNTLRKRRVVIVDPDTNKEMSVKEAYDKGLIDYETFLELSQQECEWEEITITAQDGSSRLVIIDRKTEIQYDIRELLEKKVIDQSVYDQYQSQKITLAQFAKIITSKTNSTRSSSSTSSSKARVSATSPDGPPSHSSLKNIASISVSLAGPAEAVVLDGERSPVGAIFDMEALEKISISEAHKRGLVDSISAQRLLEAQACTGGIVNPSDGRRLSIQEASRQGIIENDMATRLKPAQKAYIGFEDVKCKRKMSAAEAMREKWLPYEAGHRFLEFQFVTGGLYDPELGCRRTIEEALKVGWLDGRAAQKLQDMRHHAKILTCPKTKLKISYKEALDNCLLEENTGVKMLQAASTSSRGISSPYNFSSAPGSTSGSRTGSRTGSRRGSVDLGSPSSSTS